ncbi:MAG: tryptophan synthase subunit alpha [Dehalococcoidia bacterium]
MTERLARAFQRMRDERRTGIIPYVTVGFPTLDDTLAIVPAIEQAGADVIELGVPYSDPLADGPTIQAAVYRALQGGMTTAKCIQAVRDLRAAGVQAPLVFMGYYNPILSYGMAAFARDCAEAGVDGLIVPDLPPEESAPLRQALQPHGIALITLLAPTSTEQRIAAALNGAQGFVYCVSVAGVTGARADLPPGLPDFIARVRQSTSLPIAVGFGIGDRGHVEAVGKYADAAVVGSALINVIDSAPPSERAASAAAFIRRLAGGAD